jgi:flagellar basal-body rod protein FlgB
MSDFFNNRSIEASERAINCAFSRHQRIQDNIANIDTPGHTFSDISFKDYLSGVSRKDEKYDLRLWKTNTSHMGEAHQQPADPYPVSEYKETSLEKEMSALMETSLFFNAMITVHNLQVGSIKTAITEGRR